MALYCSPDYQTSLHVREMVINNYDVFSVNLGDVILK